MHPSKKSLLTMIMCSVGMGTAANAAQVVLLTETGFGQGLVTVNTSAPNMPISALSFLSGLGSNERLVGIDYRPLTGQLYGLSDRDAIYTLDASTGSAMKVGGGFTDNLNGGAFGFDFNPVIDKIRIVSDANQNIVAHPDTGEANIATTLDTFYKPGDVNAGMDPHVVHHAYDGNIANSPATQLRAIDTWLDVLVTQANNAGELQTVGSLGIDASDVGGFDVASSGTGYAVFADIAKGTSEMYMIDLFTGSATSIGSIGEIVSGMAVKPVPLPAAAWLFGSALLGFVGLSRRRSTASLG